MSRIGRKPIPVPPGVKISIESGLVEVSGPKGELRRQFSPEMGITLDGIAKGYIVDRASALLSRNQIGNHLIIETQLRNLSVLLRL